MMAHTGISWNAERILYFLYKNKDSYFARDIAKEFDDMSSRKVAHTIRWELMGYIDKEMCNDRKYSNCHIPTGKYKYNGADVPEKLVENMEWKPEW